MSDTLVRRLRIAAVVFAAITIGIHLFHTTYGGMVLLVYLTAGQGLVDPRPLAFLLGSFAILFLGMLVYHDVARGPAYLGIAAVSLTFAIGYGVWHTALDHGAFWPQLKGIESHEQHPVLVVLDHLLADNKAIASKVAEVGLAAVSIALYRLDAN
ncbi:MAG: hypothetical protein ABEH81_14340 [Halopenitus sp.]